MLLAKIIYCKVPALTDEACGWTMKKTTVTKTKLRLTWVTKVCGPVIEVPVHWSGTSTGIIKNRNLM